MAPLANCFVKVVQRLVVAASCVIFYILTMHLSLGHGGETGMLVILAFLACLEKLCSIMNLVFVEKAWVVVLTQRDEAALRAMNGQMRPIYLLYKLVGPLFNTIIDGFSTKVAITVNFAMKIAPVGVEYFAIARVYREVPELQESKKCSHANQGDASSSQESGSRLPHNWHHVRAIVTKSALDFNLYFHHRAFLPSIAGTLLYLTVLSFAGLMLTYSLSEGNSATRVGILKTLSMASEDNDDSKDQWLYRLLARSFNTQSNNLVKKTISIKDVDGSGVTWHLISYFRPADVLEGRLQTSSTSCSFVLPGWSSPRYSIQYGSASVGQKIGECRALPTVPLWDESQSMGTKFIQSGLNKEALDMTKPTSARVRFWTLELLTVTPRSG
ncbi:uncharacterized protein Z519_05490 [Cladophialophora bantiana CBS 173.52]|uniref:Solute carrier family 40 member n=1 Tax=Cladophialophora bantiana (strain ATCC 10958 / CBS 173.52 / CDC B-1940 / NIH 8579) TaxID=1442370 RepID=A0A0D2IBH3_CLAB1|nr:uncharacterized protein Z519_05490 [Cladophialophora bantiana CBS 173.52]KIW94174.1 hypothetical protein Z519_05490 [Cladophialophora bantiana CBS 173.52]